MLSDLEGIIILYNERAADILGVPVKQALHHHIKDVFKNSYLYKVLKNERPELNKIQILLGKQVIGNHRIFYDKDGKPAGAVTTFRSIDQAKEYAQKVSNFRDTQAILKAVFYNSDDAFYVLDDNYSIVLINPAFTKLTGISEIFARNCNINEGIINAKSITRMWKKQKMKLEGYN